MTKAELIEKRMKLMPAGQGYDFYRGWMDASRALLGLVDDVQADGPSEPDPSMLQKGKDGLIYPCPMAVQQEPSPLEVALRLYTKPDCGLTFDECVKAAFMIIDAVRAEEARRAGK